MLSKSFKKSAGFTLIEIVVVLAILAVMISIIIPLVYVGYKRGRAENAMEDLRAIDAAIHQYAVESGSQGGQSVQSSQEIKIGRLSIEEMRPAPAAEVGKGRKITFQDIKKYLPRNSSAYKLNGKDLLGNPYGDFTVGERPKVPAKTAEYFTTVLDETFWSGYY